jgi:hypothetical protein
MRCVGAILSSPVILSCGITRSMPDSGLRSTGATLLEFDCEFDWEFDWMKLEPDEWFAEEPALGETGISGALAETGALGSLCETFTLGALLGVAAGEGAGAGAALGAGAGGGLLGAAAS